MKKAILSLVVLLMAGVATAMANNALVIHLNSGETHTYVLLDEEPTISFSGDSIFVTAKSTDATYAMADVDYFNYEAKTVDVIANAGAGNGMSRQGNALVFNGLPAGSKVEVFATGGQLCSVVTADAQGHAEVSLSALPNGVYLIKAHNISTKITKK